LAGLDVLDADANALKRLSQLGELGKGGLNVHDDLGGDDARRRKVTRRSPNGQVLVEENKLWDTGWTGPSDGHSAGHQRRSQHRTAPAGVRKRSPKQ